jgi:hypothetical protein
MNKKIWSITLVLFTICAVGTVFAQSKGQSPEELIKRAKDLASAYENLERNTRLSPKAQASGYSEENRERFQENIENNLLKQSRKLEDDSSRLSTDLSYAGYNIVNGVNKAWTDQQNRDLMDAIRRIDNAKSQTFRNISRW